MLRPRIVGMRGSVVMYDYGHARDRVHLFYLVHPPPSPLTIAPAPSIRMLASTFFSGLLLYSPSPRMMPQTRGAMGV